MPESPWIFPALAGRRWVGADLDAIARVDFPATDYGNPLNDPWFCDRWVCEVATRLGADHSWGGWLEDRAHLWRGHYLPEGCAIHLGIDLNVPAGTTVLAPVSGEVMHAVPCRALGGGWAAGSCGVPMRLTAGRNTCCWDTWRTPGCRNQARGSQEAHRSG